MAPKLWIHETEQDVPMSQSGHCTVLLGWGEPEGHSIWPPSTNSATSQTHVQDGDNTLQKVFGDIQPFEDLFSSNYTKLDEKSIQQLNAEDATPHQTAKQAAELSARGGKGRPSSPSSFDTIGNLWQLEREQEWRRGWIKAYGGPPNFPANPVGTSGQNSSQ
ncbi:uncharacterized protein MELLADRAFT_69918 [Melampsora larici-populina 98AG31]|uniref:Uncharacterized protein n=1 Tax=Melampsora larici-populina (strain 98AG31 / pathotype 3-4-7) TaxID=747676 RepID=F4SCT3_MELLP|nr:uncharacterized protein MELLADRAFT_69918 [Melampsora larici-populina 98AG31]EGF97546.1 hypothetical protein MELLADRAFT_69918 [Melampsora larici-populina 98AG31]